MHSMTAALAAPPPEPDAQDGGWLADTFATVWNGLAGVLPGGNLTMFGVLLALGAYADQKGKRKKAGPVTTKTPGSWKKPFLALYGAVRSLVRAVWAVARFYAGREMRGQAKSTATFLSAGTRLTDNDDQAAVMASVALAPPVVSLVKKPRRQPSPWARKAATWLETYRGRGAAALDRTVRTVLWTVRAAGKVWRALKAVHRFLTAVHAKVAPGARTLARTLGAWHCWPYAARGLVRVILTAQVMLLLVPAWKGWVILVSFLGTLALGPFLRKMVPTEPGDDVVYGPRLWAILRNDLRLPEDEPRERWLQLPAHLGEPGARIVLRLPWTFRGGDGEKDAVSQLINSRLPGEWVGRFSFQGEHPSAVYTHKPPPKPPAPEPQCPDFVGFFDPDIQEAIANCKRGEIVIGKDAFGRIIIQKMGAGETPHWALSVGTGGGKSAFCQMVIAQLIAHGYYILVADVKRVSVTIFKGLEGVYIYNDPMNPQDMRAGLDWFKEEISARSAIAEVDHTAEFPGILALIEEANEFADISREWWDDNRKTRADEDGPADRASDPVWGTVASGARLGRHVYGNILGVFQDLRDQAMGGKGMRNLFRLKLMGNYSVNTWKNVIGTTPVPESIDEAGRMMVVEGNSQFWVQTLYGKPEELRAWALQARERTGFVEGAGLWGTPPKPSPKRLPRLLQRLSRDELPEGLRDLSREGLDDETAGGMSHDGVDVTLSGDDVTALRDRLRLIPGQGLPGDQETAPDPTAPPELLSLAEVARRLADDPSVPSADAMRQHKNGRRDDFPKGIEKNGREFYTVSQIQAYYAPQEKKA